MVGRFAVCRSYDRNSKAYMPWMLNEHLGYDVSIEVSTTSWALHRKIGEIRNVIAASRRPN